MAGKGGKGDLRAAGSPVKILASPGTAGTAWEANPRPGYTSCRTSLRLWAQPPPLYPVAGTPSLNAPLSWPPTWSS